MSYWHNPLVLTRPYKLLAGPNLNLRLTLNFQRFLAALPHCMHQPLSLVATTQLLQPPLATQPRTKD
jgi:hypothetical protein